MDELDNTLTITVEGGNREIINVLDIINSYAFNKTFIIYTAQSKPDAVFASIINESDTSYSFDTITNPEEINYINSEIHRVVEGINAV